MLISKNTQEPSDSSSIFSRIYRFLAHKGVWLKKTATDIKTSHRRLIRTSLLRLMFVKAGVLFLALLFGIVSNVNNEAINSIAPISAATEDEVLVNKDRQKQYLNGTSGAFLSAQNNSFAEIEVAGSSDRTIENIDRFNLNPKHLFLADMNSPFEVERSIQEDAQKSEGSPGYEIIEYKVQSGDSVARIAAKFEVRESTILWTNDLGNPDLVRPGDILLIPPVDGLVHEVKRGETISSIASRYQASERKILTYNDLDPNTHIFEGQVIIVPGGKKPAPSPQRTNIASSQPQQPVQQPTHSTSFIRPTSGRISQGLHPTNAVDISNSCGTPVVAAAGGVVELASAVGAFNGGYGNYVIIRHPNGTRTLYAHLSPGGVYVGRGQHVSQGQTIGSMGRTGRATGCHLHFEVRGAVNFMAR